MTKTIIGVFTSFDRANAAMAALAAAGLADAQHTRISANPDGYGYDGETTDGGTAIAPSTDGTPQGQEAHVGMLASIENFFTHLFSNDDRPASAAHYQEALRRGSTLLAVDVDEEAQIPAVEAELQRAGAVDIDAQVAHWQTDGYIGHEQDQATSTSVLTPSPRNAIPSGEREAGSDTSVTPISTPSTSDWIR